MDINSWDKKPIGNYIVDFFCSKLNLVIEIDGESHFGNEEKDNKKQTFLESIGLTVLRFDNDQVKQGLEYVLTDLENWIIEFEKTHE